jgi:hypothetical protein
MDNSDKYLSPIGKMDKKIADFCGLDFSYVTVNHPLDPVEYDMEINCPDFLDHDEDLLYLYEVDLPYECLKFSKDWKWVMGVIDMINPELLTFTNQYESTPNGGGLELEMDSVSVVSMNVLDENGVSTYYTESGIDKMQALYRLIYQYIKFYLD